MLKAMQKEVNSLLKFLIINISQQKLYIPLFIIKLTKIIIIKMRGIYVRTGTYELKEKMK